MLPSKIANMKPAFDQGAGVGGADQTGGTFREEELQSIFESAT